MAEVVRTSGEARDTAGRVEPIRLPVPLVLGTIVTVATALHATLALRSPSPWIVPDELIYSELAKSLGEGSLPRIRGDVSFDWGLGYPALLAPVWAVLDDVTKAYAVAKILNALVLSLTAVPAYFLARRFVTEGHALVAAGLSVALPSMLYAGTLMTEVALYPVVVMSLFAMAVALERPELRIQAAALGAIALACTIKTLAVVLLPAYIAAICLYQGLDARGSRRWRAGMRDYAPTGFVLVAGTAALVSVILASGHRPREALGTYANVLDHFALGAAPRWALLHLAELDLYLAVIPFATALIVAARGLRSSSGRPERLFVALAAPACVAWLVAVATFASVPFLEIFEYPENLQRLQERSVFMLAPLFFIGFMLWLEDRRGRPVVLIGVVATAALLPAVIPLGDFDSNVRFQALALVPWVAVADDVVWPLAGVLFTFGLALVFLLAVRARASNALFIGPVVFVFAAVALVAHLSMGRASEWTRSAAWGASPNWVDDAVGDQGSVSVLWAEPAGRPYVDLAARHRIVFVGEFFNRSIGTVFELGSPMPYGLPTTEAHLERGLVVLKDGSPARLGKFVLVPCFVHVSGVPIARDPVTGARVFRVHDSVRARIAKPDSCGERRRS
jgi:hypothetical protein